MASDPLFIRLYLDEDVTGGLAEAIRQHGFDCLSAVEAGMRTKSDEEQLTFAGHQGRCILSFNAKDFHRIAQEWADAGVAHGGIVVTRQRGRDQFGALLAQVLEFLNTTAADEMTNTFRHL